jgi:hypothetical protein
MGRRWAVTAVYQPMPREIVRGYSKEVALPPNAGIQFKFTVVGVDTDAEAVAAVMQSGYFVDRMAKQFGFVAKEVA